MLRDSDNSWIFQAVSKMYDLPKALADLWEDYWLVTNGANRMCVAQHVFFWFAGPSGGLMADGVITAAPAKMPAPDWQMPYWVGGSREAARIPCYRVRVAYKQKYLTRRLRRPELASNRVLARQRPIGPPYVGTNFMLAPGSEAELRRLLDNLA